MHKILAEQNGQKRGKSTDRFKTPTNLQRQDEIERQQQSNIKVICPQYVRTHYYSPWLLTVHPHKPGQTKYPADTSQSTDASGK